MIEVEITQEMLDEAKLKSEDLGVLNRSYLKGEGNMTGFLGERIAKDVLGAEYSNVDRINYDHDLIMKGSGITIDVKTKKTKVEPKSHYECGIMDYNSNKQHCDFYAFVRVRDDYKVGWFLGVKEKYKYILESKFVPKGTIDKRNDFEQMTDSYNLEISKLDSEIRPSNIKASYLFSVLDKKIELTENEREKLLKHKYEIDVFNNMKAWIANTYSI